MKLYRLDGFFIKETPNRPTNFTGFVKDSDGTKIWFFEGKRHRLDRPAYEDAHGTKQWYINGKLHRIGGPAIERPDGYIDNINKTKEEHDLSYSIMKLKGLV